MKGPSGISPIEQNHSMHPIENIRNWKNRFRTSEEIAARYTDSSGPYWRFDDPFCQRLLKTGAEQKIRSGEPQFMGTFFPFYRKASVLALPHNEEFLSRWLLLAFLAGEAYGDRHPNEVEELFETDRSQLQASWDLLGALKTQMDNTGIGRGRFASALEHFCERQNRTSGQNITQQIITHSQNAIWAGMLAATGAKNDILQMEFLENVQLAIRSSGLPHHMRAIISAALDAHSRSTLDLLLHPLLDVAIDKYIPTPLEGQVILKFLNDELIRFDSKGEQDCPVSDKDLLAWVEDATTYGQELMRSNNDLIAKVFNETGQVQMRTILKTIHKVLVKIEENRPAHIANEILRWHKNTFGWSKPKYYGEAVERIVHCVDMAIWLTWAPALSEFPDVGSTRWIKI